MNPLLLTQPQGRWLCDKYLDTVYTAVSQKVYNTRYGCSYACGIQLHMPDKHYLSASSSILGSSLVPANYTPPRSYNPIIREVYRLVTCLALAQPSYSYHGPSPNVFLCRVFCKTDSSRMVLVLPTRSSILKSY